VCLAAFVLKINSARVYVFCNRVIFYIGKSTGTTYRPNGRRRQHTWVCQACHLEPYMLYMIGLRWALWRASHTAASLTPGCYNASAISYAGLTKLFASRS